MACQSGRKCNGRTFRLALTLGHNRFLWACAGDIHAALTQLEGILVRKENEEESRREKRKKSTQAFRNHSSVSPRELRRTAHERTLAALDRLKSFTLIVFHTKQPLHRLNLNTIKKYNPKTRTVA